MKTRYLFGLPFASVTIDSSNIEFLVDTGFNGALMLPKELVEKLNLKRIGFTKYTMADGTISKAAIFVT